MYKHLLNQHNLFAESLGQEPLKKQQQPQHHFEHTSTMGASTPKYLTFPKIPPFWTYFHHGGVYPQIFDLSKNTTLLE